MLHSSNILHLYSNNMQNIKKSLYSLDSLLCVKAGESRTTPQYINIPWSFHIHHYKSKLNSQKVFKSFCLPISFLLDTHIPSWKVNTIYRLLQAGYVRVDDIQNRNIYTSRFILYMNTSVSKGRKKFFVSIQYEHLHIFVIFFFCAT